LQWAGRLEILEEQPLQVFAGRQAFDAIGVLLVGPLVVPEPVLAAIGEDDEGRFDVFRVAATLFLGVVGIGVLALGFEVAQDAAEFAFEELVRAAGGHVVFKQDLAWIQQVPAAVREGAVNQDAGAVYPVSVSSTSAPRQSPAEWAHLGTAAISRRW
jgi:hypothetical protein